MAAPATVPLPSVYDLIAAGLWPVDTARDTTNDVTDEQIAELL